MVNSRDSLSKIPSTNHDGTPYILDLDIYKEGYWAYDISNYYKGRVDDNGTPFQVRWFEHGQIKNVQGLRPFIRGTVGQHTVDDETDPDNPKVVPSPDCSQIDQTGETTDTMPGGIAVYRMVNQCFTQEGMFYGEIGLKDSSGLVLSSVDIAFKVLGGRMNMLGARKFYVSEFEKALDNLNAIIEKTKKDFSQQLSQVITDARNTYNAQVKNSQDALNALDGEIRATRQEQANLSQRLVGTEQQIAEHDVVTRPEFNKLDTKITDRLAKMDLTPHLYANQQEMEQKNPQGTGSLCVTADTNHKWIFDYDANNWIDAGPYTFALLDPGQKELLSTNPNNLLPDPDFKSTNTDYWFEAHNDKPGIFNIDSSNSIDGSNIATITETGSTGAWIQTHLLPVGNHHNYAFRCYLNCRHTQVPAYFAVIFSNKDKTDIAWHTVDLQDQANDDFLTSNFNQVVPVAAVYFRVAFILPKGGTIKVYKPQMVWGDEIRPYQSNYHAISTNPDNLVPDSDFKLDYQIWKSGGNQVIPRTWIDKENKIGNSNSMVLQALGKKGCYVVTQNYPIVSGQNYVSVSAYIKGTGLTSAAGFNVVFVDASGKITGQAGVAISQDSSEFVHVTTNSIVIPLNSTQFRFQVFLNDLGTVSVCRPLVNYGTYAVSYSQAEFFSKFKNKLLKTNYDNILNNADFNAGLDFWEIGANGNLPTVTFDDDNSFNNYRMSVITGDEEKGFWINSVRYPVKQHKKLKFSAIVKLLRATKSDNQAYLSVWFDNSEGRSTSTVSIDIGANQELSKLESSVIQIPSGAYSVRLTITGFNNDVLYMTKPKITFDPDLEEEEPRQSLPQLEIDVDPGKVGNNYISTPFRYSDGSTQIKGYMQIALQGDSSRGFPKKNYKIKLFQDSQLKNKLKIKPKSSWNANNKFNLKANWIDATQSRNLTNAHIFKLATSVTPFEDKTVAKKLSKAQAFGQMEGFPIEITMADGYHGLYTFNTKKDDKTFGMDSDNVGEEAIEFEKPGSQLKGTQSKIDGTDYGTVVQDKPTPELVTNFNKFLTFLNTSSDEEIKAHLKDYIDIHSVINTYLWGIFAYVWDTSGKSNLLLTYNNGSYWYMIPYDLDSTWGLKPEGKIHNLPLPEYDFAKIGVKNIMQFVTEENEMKIFNIMYKLFKPELKKQYFYLRNSVWSNERIILEFKKFIDAIPQSVYKREQEKWPQIPSIKDADFSQIQQAGIQRGANMDKFMQNLVSETDPLEELKARVTNLEHGTTQK